MLVLSACAGDDKQPATMALQADEVSAAPPVQPSAPPPAQASSAQTIKFMWSGGKGQPNVIIHQTSSSTGPVTEEFLARDITIGPADRNRDDTPTVLPVALM